VDSFSKSAGNVLRRARTASGMTLQQAARRSNGRFAATSIAGYERGERQISLIRFCDLANLYAVRPERLLAEVMEELRPEGRRDILIDLTRAEALEDREVGTPTQEP
jgi:transcriptional regulator with XRE-family HTH domain